jgi:hypothetical protein
MDSRIETMVRMGYIEEINTNSTCGEAVYCMGCPSAKKVKSDQCSGDSIKIYRITDKGNQIINK